MEFSQRGIYLIDSSAEAYGSFFKAERILFHKKSSFQDIIVFDTIDAGRILMLDDVFNVSTKMEAFYGEPVAHLPIGLIRNLKNKSILIIGGGDFGVANHALKHKDVGRVVMCELDPMVVDVARLYFPDWAACEKDKRLTVLIEDGFEYLVKGDIEQYDAVIIDSTDPFSNADKLISEDFYKRVFSSLKLGGVLMQIIADTVFYKDTWKYVLPNIRKVTNNIRPAFVPIPYHVSGSWGFLIAGKNPQALDTSLIDQDYLDTIPNLSTMTPDIVKGWFSIPPFARELFA
jgi:spermidine synthase